MLPWIGPINRDPIRLQATHKRWRSIFQQHSPRRQALGRCLQATHRWRIGSVFGQTGGLKGCEFCDRRAIANLTARSWRLLPQWRRLKNFHRIFKKALAPSPLAGLSSLVRVKAVLGDDPHTALCPWVNAPYKMHEHFVGCGDAGSTSFEVFRCVARSMRFAVLTTSTLSHSTFHLHQLLQAPYPRWFWHIRIRARERHVGDLAHIQITV